MSWLVCDIDLSWSAAAAACASYQGGWGLAKIDDSLENGRLDSWLPDVSAWIGLTDRAREGTYVWTGYDGSALGRYRPWQPGEPNNDSGGDPADCVLLGNTATWYDGDCRTTREFFCEQRP